MLLTAAEVLVTHAAGSEVEAAAALKMGVLLSFLHMIMFHCFPIRGYVGLSTDSLLCQHKFGLLISNDFLYRLAC